MNLRKSKAMNIRPTDGFTRGKGTEYIWTTLYKRQEPDNSPIVELSTKRMRRHSKDISK